MKSPVMKLSQNLQIDRTLPDLLQMRLKHAQEEFAGALRTAQVKSATMLPPPVRCAVTTAKPKPAARARTAAGKPAES